MGTAQRRWGSVILCLFLLACEPKLKSGDGKWSVGRPSGASETQVIYDGAKPVMYRISHRGGDGTVQLKIDGTRLLTLDKGKTLDVEGRTIELSISKNTDDTSLRASGTFERIGEPGGKEK
jgi:hypothetical protein